MHELKTGTAPGAAVHADNPLYRTPRNLLALFSLSSVIVGLAERAVAEFVEFTRERRSRGLRVADLEAMQLMVAEAAAQAETAALIGEHTIDRNTDTGRIPAGDHRRAGGVVAAQRVLFDAARPFRRQADLRGGRRHRALCQAIRCRKSSATSWLRRRICR